MPHAVDDPFGRCDRSVLVETFGLVTRVHVGAVDEEELRFHHRVLDRAPAVHARVWLDAEGGFFPSLFGKDGAPKTMALEDPATGTRTVKTFRYWSGLPSFVPPFAATAFTAAHLLMPGDVVQSPDGRKTILITGDNHVGKTALSMALFEQGWAHVSDQLAVFRRPGLAVARQHGIVGLRRGTLARYRSRLGACETRSVISEVTGEVVLARVADLFPGMPAPVPGRITGHVHLVREHVPSPADAAEFAARRCYPLDARPEADRVLRVPTRAVAVPSFAAVADVAHALARDPGVGSLPCLL